MLKILLIILLVYFGVKILSRLFAPVLLKYLSNKAAERFGGQFRDFGNQKQQSPRQKEGEISIEKMPNKKESNTTVGEYVDYEEID
ncbi:DUF4834 family protein [Lacinutrix sp. MedPE-SW]|uniref:DUF4834 family protein n=1 Tax=Lacinutrix sp. MedPE-SW TaxID=1860087 RepID=UPI000924074E|nr:DUF4834 family protein [Lacinutrix sp. MedPE-SW]OIQ23956.1 MAG: DUF4834 domain-containing protein [Lacinutrix sp. MedPE-SW]